MVSIDIKLVYYQQSAVNSSAFLALRVFYQCYQWKTSIYTRLVLHFYYLSVENLLFLYTTLLKVLVLLKPIAIIFIVAITFLLLLRFLYIHYTLLLLILNTIFDKKHFQFIFIFSITFNGKQIYLTRILSLIS